MNSILFGLHRCTFEDSLRAMAFMKVNLYTGTKFKFIRTHFVRVNQMTVASNQNFNSDHTSAIHYNWQIFFLSEHFSRSLDFLLLDQFILQFSCYYFLPPFSKTLDDFRKCWLRSEYRLYNVFCSFLLITSIVVDRSAPFSKSAYGQHLKVYARSWAKCVNVPITVTVQNIDLIIDTYRTGWRNGKPNLATSFGAK